MGTENRGFPSSEGGTKIKRAKEGPVGFGGSSWLYRV